MGRKPASKGGYRLNAQQLFLTFPKPPEDTKKEDIISFFDATYPCEWIVVGRELHKDGTPHFHVCCRLLKKMDTTNPREFDWLFNKHGNYQAMKSKSKCIGYCTKDGDFIAEGIDVRPFLKQNAYEQALLASTIEAGLKILRRANAGDYMKNLQRYEYALRKHHPKPPAKCSYPISNFVHSMQDLSKALLIWGKSNCGKTQYALAHFKAPLEVCHIDMLKQLDPETHDGIVFNDMSFHDLPRWTPGMVISLLDMDSEAQLDVRYGYAIIPQRFPRIFTYNEYDPFTNHKFTSEQKAAVERRLVRFYVQDKLYDTTHQQQVLPDTLSGEDIPLQETSTTTNVTSRSRTYLTTSNQSIPTSYRSQGPITTSDTTVHACTGGGVVIQRGRGTLRRSDEFPSFPETVPETQSTTSFRETSQEETAARASWPPGRIHDNDSVPRPIQERSKETQHPDRNDEDMLQVPTSWRMDVDTTETTVVLYPGSANRMGEVTGSIMCPYCYNITYSGKCPKCNIYI